MRDGRVLAAKRNAELVDAILERASDLLGDITPHVMQRYYAAMPQAKERFAFHNPERPSKLEGEMIEQALYCLIRWHTDRSEIEIILDSTVPHHLYALDIPLELFTGMMDSLCETVAETIPASEADELRCWQEMQRDITLQMEESLL